VVFGRGNKGVWCSTSGLRGLRRLRGLNSSLGGDFVEFGNKENINIRTMPE
jgi:hypothetical protein